jgi:hypothetical protein
MELSLKLTIEEINYILQTLGTRPYGEVKGLLEKIKGDAETQLSTMQPVPAEAKPE